MANLLVWWVWWVWWEPKKLGPASLAACASASACRSFLSCRRSSRRRERPSSILRASPQCATTMQWFFAFGVCVCFGGRPQPRLFAFGVCVCVCVFLWGGSVPAFCLGSKGTAKAKPRFWGTLTHAHRCCFKTIWMRTEHVNLQSLQIQSTRHKLDPRVENLHRGQFTPRIGELAVK